MDQNAGTAGPGDEVYQRIQELVCPTTRTRALMELSRQRMNIPGMGMALWKNAGAVEVLRQEVESIYPELSRVADLTVDKCNMVCNSVALFQTIATDEETRPLFLKAELHQLFFPLLRYRRDNDHKCQYLRLTALGVLGALLKDNEDEALTALLDADLLPLCLPILENATHVEMTVASYIVHKLMADKRGLDYVCAEIERLYALTTALAQAVQTLQTGPSRADRLLKHIVRCYERLAENPRACDSLRNCLPICLQVQSFEELPDSIATMGDEATQKSLRALLVKVHQRGQTGS